MILPSLIRDLCYLNNGCNYYTGIISSGSHRYFYVPVFTVICNFRGSVTQGLALEVGETVQILEKCEGTVLIS